MKHLLAACGIGGARVEIRLEEKEHPRGSRAHGVVVLTGGAVSQHVERVTVRLVEASSSRRLPETHSKRLLRQAAVLDAGSIEEYPFSIEVPDTVGLSGRSHMLNRTLVAATVEIPWSVGASDSVNLQIVEHREIAAMRLAMRSLGFREQYGTALDSLPKAFAAGYWSPVSKDAISVSTIYEPPRSLAGKIASVTIHMGVERGKVLGNVMIQSGNGLVQPGAGIWGGKTERFSLQIAREHLRDREGNPRAEVAEERINEILDRALARIEGARSTLLRGSSAPGTAPNELLRSANGQCDGSADALLRPAPEAQARSDSTRESAERK